MNRDKTEAAVAALRACLPPLLDGGESEAERHDRTVHSSAIYDACGALWVAYEAEHEAPSMRLGPCQFCGTKPFPMELESQPGRRDRQWVIRCSSSHCAVTMRAVADGFRETFTNGPAGCRYTHSRLTALERKWNRGLRT